MRQDFLLHSSEAQILYETVAHFPLIDWHNHLSVKDIQQDWQFHTITELWVSSDPYKHRAMRICGEKEKLITEDERKKGEDKIQKLTDTWTAKVDEVGKKKEKEIMEV